MTCQRRLDFLLSFNNLKTIYSFTEKNTSLSTTQFCAHQCVYIIIFFSALVCWPRTTFSFTVRTLMVRSGLVQGGGGIFQWKEKKVRPALQHRPTTVNNTESSLSFSILLVTRLNRYFMRGFVTHPAHVFCCFPGNRHFCAFSFSVGLCIRIVSLIVHTKNYFLKHRVITFSYF